MALKIDNYFVDHDPFENINWTTTRAEIKDVDGNIIFSGDIEAPDFWSEQARKITAQHYLKVVNSIQETSVKQLISRVVETIGKFVVKDKLVDESDREKFVNQLKYLMVNQYFCFNSPVLYNLGCVDNPQSSACFIQSVEDTMESLEALQTSEIELFRKGSGTGTNVSNLRHKKAKLSKGGTSSGPVSFMRAFDGWASTTKSAGRTRRAAKLYCMDVTHPDILDFIECKVIAEKMAHTLIEAGWSADFNKEVYTLLPWQNANHSIRVTDDFIIAVLEDRDWDLVDKEGKVISTLKAKDIFRKNAEAAHFTGDPGIQFNNQINRWHTCKNSGSINASNPCSEYMFLDDSACNLASLNLKKFMTSKFELEKFDYAVYISIISMEALVNNSSYPTIKIHQNSIKFRPLGLGWSNGGALLMSLGIPYDSEHGRKFLGAITCYMSAKAYLTSCEIAKEVGPCEGFNENKESFMEVLDLHELYSEELAFWAMLDMNSNEEISSISHKGCSLWNQVMKLAKEYGVRNSQATLMAPTGQISFFMDCDTTGIEPELSLVKYKNLAGGGVLKIVNQTVKEALEKLGYSEEQKEEILHYIEQNETIEGSNINTDHLPIFDCSLVSTGKRVIAPEAHINMMASLQPFLSGAISKTVNISEESTVEDIENLYMKAWRKGLKSVAIYRDNCKKSQPLTTKKTEILCNFCDGKTKMAGKCRICVECGETSSCG